MYFFKTITKDIFNELFVIIIFSTLLLFTWFMSLGSLNETLSQSGGNSARREFSEKNYKNLAVEDFLLEGSSGEFNVSRSKITSFIQETSGTSVLMLYDAMESSKGVPVYVSAGLYTDFIDEFKDQSEEVKVIVSDRLEPIYGSSERIMNVEFDNLIYSNKRISTYHPNVYIDTSMNEDWIWINFLSIEDLLQSGIHTDQMKLINGLVFQDYDSNSFLELQESFTNNSRIISANNVSETENNQGEIMIYQTIISTITTILGTLTYLTYLANSIQDKYRDYFIHYFWGTNTKAIYTRILMFLVFPNILPLLFLVFRGLTFSPIISIISLLIYLMSLLILSIMLYKKFIKESQSPILWGGKND